MDNLTHSLTGLALARVGLNRSVPHATLLLILSANAPDIDIIALSRGPLRYLELHRGYSHSLLGLPVMAALCVLFAASVYREKLPWVRAFLLCCAGVASHLLLDWTNSYGIRLFLPFSSRWLHADLNGLYDVWILAALVFAALWPLFSRLVSKEIGDRPPSGRGSAAAALLFFLLFDILRAGLHSQSVAELEARLYDDAAPMQAAALPDSFSPLRWRDLVETQADYRLLESHIGTPLSIEDARIFYKPPITRSLRNAKATAPFRYFVYFARFPVWSQMPVTMGNGTGTWLDLTDLRFGEPGSGSFHCIAIESPGGEVLRSLFTFSSGRELVLAPQRDH